jgi:putative GTP pyrophosphokinase
MITTTRQLLQQVQGIYSEAVRGVESEVDKSNVLIGDALRPILGADATASLRSLILSKPYIPTHVAAQAASSPLFRQPAILLAYLGVASKPAETVQAWPLTRDELRPIFTQLGRSIDDF